MAKPWDYEDAAGALLSRRMSCRISWADGTALWQAKRTVVCPSVTTWLISFLEKLFFFVKPSFSLCTLSCDSDLLFLPSVFSAGFPQVCLDLTVIYQSNFLWIHPPQELTGGSPLVLVWWDDFNSHIPTANPHGGDGSFQLIPFFFPRCHYTLPLIRSDLTHATKREEITMPLSLESQTSSFWLLMPLFFQKNYPESSWFSSLGAALKRERRRNC